MGGEVISDVVAIVNIELEPRVDKWAGAAPASDFTTPMCRRRYTFNSDRR